MKKELMKLTVTWESYLETLGKEVNDLTDEQKLATIIIIQRMIMDARKLIIEST